MWLHLSINVFLKIFFLLSSSSSLFSMPISPIKNEANSETTKPIFFLNSKTAVSTNELGGKPVYSWYDHITPIFVDLHWLPIEERIQFKILLLTYKALNGMAPTYLKEIISRYEPKTTLRSSSAYLRKQESFKLLSYGKRAFTNICTSATEFDTNWH